MKRIHLALPALLLALCLLPAGCSKTVQREETPPLAGHSGNYETQASLSYRDLQAEATIHQGNPGSCSVAFTSPASLTDLAFVFRQDAVDVSYKGLSYTLDPGTLPGNAAALMAVTAVNSAMKDTGLSVAYEEDSLVLTGDMETGQFLLRLDRDSGNLMKLSVPAEELEIEFLNFRFLD